MKLIQTKNKTRKMSTSDLVMAGMFTAIICVVSQIVLPTQPIPYTLGLFAIFLTGALLTPRNSLLAVLVYLLLGAVGIPVFNGFKGGLQILTGPTGGYLMAYPLMALVTSIFYKSGKKYKVFALTVGMLVSLVLCYLLGTLWFTIITPNSFYAALTMCVFPFVLFDLVKIALAISISFVIRKTAMRNIL